MGHPRLSESVRLTPLRTVIAKDFTMTQHSLLALFAHPDDEAFGVGGALACYSAQGAHVTLVCATRGEVGDISDAALATPETLGEVREGELRCAARALGVHELIFLDHRDSGMAGTPPNQDPRAFARQPAEVVVPTLVGILRRARPQVVITFDPTGGYGHPDHIAIHTHTVEAFHAAGDATRYPNQGDAWQPERLLYSVIPRSTLRAWRDEMAARGEDTSQFDSPEGQAMGWPDEEVHLYLDVIDYIPNKWAAFQCHATQFGDDSFFDGMPDDQRQLALGREAFVQAWPPLEPGDRLTDLFPSE